MAAPVAPTGDPAAAARRRGRGRLRPPGPGQSRAVENLRDAVLESRRHHVDTADPRDLEDLLDDLGAHRHSLIGHPAGRNALQPAADLVRDPQARDVAAHVLQGPQRADRADPGQDLAAPVQSQVPHLGHPACEGGEVEDELRLHELRAGGDLLAEPGRAEPGRRRERVLDRSDEPVRRRVQLAPGQQPPLVAHGAGGPHELDAVEVEHRLGVGVVAEPRVIAGHQEQIADAQRGGGQQIGLQRDAVAVAAGDLHDRFDARGQREEAPRPVGQPHVRALAVGDVDRVHPAPQRLNLAAHRLRVGSPRRADFGGHRRLPGFQAAAQRRPGQRRPGQREGHHGSTPGAPSPMADAAPVAHSPSSRPFQ
jgi:hypothetical protein